MSMRTKSITKEIMLKVWNLHQNRVDNKLIATSLDISTASAQRIIHFMTLASKGEDVDKIDGNNHQKQKAWAKEIFAPTKPEKKEDTDDRKIDDHNTAEFMLKILYALEKQNELLERFLNEFGVPNGENK